MDGCDALRDKDIHERKDTHGRGGTLPAWLLVLEGGVYKTGGFGGGGFK